MLHTEMLQVSPPISIPWLPSVDVLDIAVAVAVAADVIEAVVDIVILDMVEEAVVAGIDMPLIGSMVSKVRVTFWGGYR